jgi:hypothetical protein
MQMIDMRNGIVIGMGAAKDGSLELPQTGVDSVYRCRKLQEIGPPC